ncbi:MAG: CAP domain-containing protein [Nannocystaceae bacterium]|nr:CAP domain-containing protein [bacterium]
MALRAPGSIVALAFVAALAGGAAGCDMPRAGGERSSARNPAAGRRGVFDGITLTPLEVQLSGPPATQYGAPTPHALSPTEQSIAAAMTEQGMVPDPGLHRASRELARTLPDGANIPSTLIEAVLSWAGIVHPPPRLVVVELPEDPAACFASYTAACAGAVRSLVGKVERTDSRIPPRFGVGVARGSNGDTRMVAAVLDPMVAMAPIPVTMPARQTVQVRGRLVGARKDPSVEVVDPGGRGFTASTSISLDGSFVAQIECAARGAYQVEVMAEGSHGPEVAANFPLYCDAKPPTRLRVELERIAAGVDESAMARANFAHLNEERKRRGLSPLSWDDRAAKVASAHSKDMARNGFVGHVSPRTGDVSARFERNRIVGSVIRENVARGYGPKGVHDSLMSSPGHRVNLLADDVTHVGIGVVIGPEDPEVSGAPRPLFVTQNFFKKPGAGAPRDGQLAPTIRARVDGARAQRGLAQAQWDDGLDAVAATLAARVASGRRLPSGWENEVFDLGYETVTTHQVSGADFDQLSGVDLFLEPTLAAGIGVARLPRGEGFTMIVLTVGK